MATPKTTLSAAIATAGATTATVRDVQGFADSAETNDLVLIDSEQLLISAGLGTLSWSTITRAYNGTTAATHADASVVTRLVRNYTDLAAVRTLLDANDLTSAAPVAYLLDCIEAANAWVQGEVGRYIGPSTDTSRTFNVTANSKSLRIPGGIRSVSAITVGQYTGDTHVTATITDVVLGPQTWELLPGLTYDSIEFIDRPDGDVTSFYRGTATAVVTGSFGPAEPPPTLSRIAGSVAVWLYKSRGAGEGGILGTGELGEVLIDVLTPADFTTIQRFRRAVATYGYV